MGGGVWGGRKNKLNTTTPKRKLISLRSTKNYFLSARAQMCYVTMSTKHFTSSIFANFELFYDLIDNLNSDFLWKSHVKAITSKATQRIYFLKQLRHVGVPQSNLLHFYTGNQACVGIRCPSLESLAL